MQADGARAQRTGEGEGEWEGEGEGGGAGKGKGKGEGASEKQTGGDRPSLTLHALGRFTTQ